MIYAAAIQYFPKITYQRAKRLHAYFSNWENAWHAELPELVQAGWDENIAVEFIAWREKTDATMLATERERQNIHTITLGEPAYPRLLSEIADPPFVLFVRGQLPIEESRSVGVVGTRRCSAYGKQVTELLVEELAGEQVTIVSGLALGIDGYAHATALTKNSLTIAVLGSGVDKETVYPASHKSLAEEIIAKGGALVSEYPPGFQPTQYSFPARNRIIAGLTLGTLVTEAPLESGALITATCALEYNRTVFAVPHPITSVLGAGCNNLLKLGARPVTEASDILEELRLQSIERTVVGETIAPATPTEATLLAILSREPVHIDVIIKQTGLNSSVASSTLSLMEMKGKIRNVGQMMYTLK